MGMGALGAAAGFQGQSQANMTQTGSYADRVSRGALRGLDRLTNTGPGKQDVKDSLQSQRDLAKLLQQYSQGGFLPNQADFQTAQNYSQDIFAPERQAVMSGFQEQNQRVSQMAARLGRPVNDPILQAKLAQEQTRQLGDVGARQTAFRAQTAQQLPLQRLGFAQGLADVRQGLASQAFANRQMLVQLGNQTFQGAVADREARTQYQNQGFRGALIGGLAGMQTNMQLAGSFMSMGAGGGGMGGMGRGSAVGGMSGGQIGQLGQQQFLRGTLSNENAGGGSYGTGGKLYL